MAIDEVDQRLEQARKPGFGIGLLKGMRVLLKHLVKHNAVIQYPDVKQDLAPRTRGVIALKEENCTVCMLCARECPDWCIYIDSHKETLPPKREGGRPRKRNVLDRFAIDYALCMYCGICVEVCPYDALFWSREFEYAEYDIRQLTHEKERLSDWMATVLPPPELEEGAELPSGPAKPAAAPAATKPAPAPTQPATAARPASTTSSAVEARPEQAVDAPTSGTAAPTESKPAAATPDAPTTPEPETAKPTPELTEETKAEEMDASATATPEPAAKIDESGKVEEEGPQAEVEKAPASPKSTAVTQTAVPEAAPAPRRPAPKLEDLEEPEAAHARVIDEQTKAGSSPQVAQARAKVARVKAERARAQASAGASRAEPATPEPSGAPAAEEPKPSQGPVAPTQEEKAGEQPQAEEKPQAAAPAEAMEDPDVVYERVLEEERAKGSSDAVATARAKAARMRAIKGTKGPGG